MKIKLHNVSKIYDDKIHALKNVHLTIEQGEFVCIKGASGSGKSTLLNIVGLIDHVTDGSYFLNDINVNQLNENKLAALRNDCFGFVFQQYNLLPYLTARDNILLPFLYRKKYFSKKEENILMELCERFSVEHVLHKRADVLSGGEKQRVALIRAVIKQANIIITDEPTGNLDETNRNNVVHLLKQLNAEGKTIIMVTHDTSIWENAPIRYSIENGSLKKDV